MRQQMEEEQWDLCRLLDAALHGRPAEMLPPAEKYGAILELADRHRVLPLLYDVLAPKLPEEDENRKRLEKRSAETVRQSYRLLFLGKYVTGLLREHGIETVLLKGSGTAGLYPVPELRKSGDIDLLVVDQKAGEKAYEVLHEHGFRKAPEQHAHHHIVCVGTEQIGIEIHVALAEPFDSKSVNEWLAAHQAEFLAHCERTAVMGVEFPVLQPAYHAFYLLLHMLQHFLRAGFGLKLLCDWVVFWEKGYGSGVEEHFCSMAEECRVMGFARLVTAVCVKYLGLSGEKVPLLLCRFDWEAEAANLEAFLTEILEAEEFGKSSADRMVALRGTGWRDYCREFHHQMLLTYPGAGRYRILHPVLWVMMFCGFAYRNVKMRRVSGYAVLKKARARGKLVEEMKLFR